MPGAQLAVMMAESMLPESMLDWFGVVKKSVIERYMTSKQINIRWILTGSQLF